MPPWPWSAANWKQVAESATWITERTRRAARSPPPTNPPLSVSTPATGEAETWKNFPRPWTVTPFSSGPLCHASDQPGRVCRRFNFLPFVDDGDVQPCEVGRRDAQLGFPQAKLVGDASVAAGELGVQECGTEQVVPVGVLE